VTKQIQANSSSDLKSNKNFLLFRKFFVVLIALFICFLVVICLYFLSEKYFFDKLFNQKSLLHGYYQFWPNEVSDWQLVAEKFNQDQRNKDLLNLIYAEEGDQEALAYFTKERNGSTFKIAMIGDSMFFGLGVRKNQTVAYYLQKILKTNNSSVKIYNYSFAGDDILDNYIKYKLVQKYLKPDLIVLGLVDNDLIFDNIGRYPGKTELNERLKESCPGRTLIEWKKEDRIKNDLDFNRLVFLSSFVTNSQNYCFLTQLGQGISEENIILLPFNYTNAPYFITECSNEDQLIFCIYKQIFNRYLAAFNKNIPIIDLYNLDIEPISKNEQHFNKSANFRLAQRIANFIFEKYPIFQ